MDIYALRASCQLLNEQVFDGALTEEDLRSIIGQFTTREELLQYFLYRTAHQGKHHKLYNIIYAFNWYDH